jgi:hypothetical protein
MAARCELSTRACRRRLAETWEERRRADAMDVRRTSTHWLHSSAVPASGWGEQVAGAVALGCYAFKPARKLKVAPPLSPFALVSTLKAVNFDEESSSDRPKMKDLDLFSIFLSKRED